MEAQNKNSKRNTNNASRTLKEMLEVNRFTTNFEGRQINILGVQNPKVNSAEISVSYSSNEKNSYLKTRESRLNKLQSVQSNYKSKIAQAIKEVMGGDSKSHFFGKDKSKNIQMVEQPRSIYLGKHPKGVVMRKVDKSLRNHLQKNVRSNDNLLESSKVSLSAG